VSSNTIKTIATAMMTVRNALVVVAAIGVEALSELVVLPFCDAAALNSNGRLVEVSFVDVFMAEFGATVVVALVVEAPRTTAAHSSAFDAFGHCALHASFTGLHFLQEPSPVSLKKHFMFSRHQRHE
jgi:hypothetical protein